MIKLFSPAVPDPVIAAMAAVITAIISALISPPAAAGEAAEETASVGNGSADPFFLDQLNILFTRDDSLSESSIFLSLNYRSPPEL